jgi:Domain of unknown function (DUF6468)
MSVPLIIEALVALLLVLTIVYCVRLNRSIQQFKGQDRAMKATIAELVTATETAHRAIAGLKATVRDADATLGERLRGAETFSAEIKDQIEGGQDVLGRLAQIAALKPIAARNEKRVPDTQKIKAQAQAFVERARTRAQGRAA